MMVPFQDRARVFHAVVAADRAAARDMDALSGSMAGHKFVTIRRNSLLEARGPSLPVLICGGGLSGKAVHRPAVPALLRSAGAAQVLMKKCGSPCSL